MNQVDLGVPIVIGSGVAGLSVALGLESCVVVTKTKLGGGSSEWAQGGVATALDSSDHVAFHANDTMAVSGGLAVESAVHALTEGGPEAIARLVETGAVFDRSSDGSLKLGREAGHSHRRIVHADGDATGAEIMRALVEAVNSQPSIDVREHTNVVDLIMRGEAVGGVVVIDETGERTIWTAPAVVLATGGIGQLYARTTNPIEVTGDGIAMAARAGAKLADMEFVQFHPTGLDVGLDPVPLLTEALRGDGAVLVDDAGHRYMIDIHPDAELAPRDVVARANYERRGNSFLDARCIGADFAERFPTVFAIAMEAGFDPRTDVLPVTAVQHYFMGGIAADPNGVTSLPGLYAVGETASTGVHGANRLASNSLLEGLVFGQRVAVHVRSATSSDGALRVPQAPDQLRATGSDGLGSLRDIMWQHAGVQRNEESLRAGLHKLEDLAGELTQTVTGRNALVVAQLILGAALERRESRGAHSRTDFPDADPTQAGRSLVAPRPLLSVA